MNPLSSSLPLEALARLRQIGTQINHIGVGDLANVHLTLQQIVDGAIEAVPDTSAVLYTYDEDEAVFDAESRVAAEGLTTATQADIPRVSGMGMRALQRQRRVLSYEEDAGDINPAKLAVGAQVMSCSPLVVAGKTLGVLYIYLHEKRHFSELELLILDNFVNQAALTLYLAQQLTHAQQEQERKSRELLRLRRGGMLISSRSSLDETLETILQMALEILDAKYGIFRLVDKERKNLLTRAVFGEGLGRPAIEALPINADSITGRAALSKEPLVIADLTEPEWRDIYYPFDHELKMRSELVVPLIGAGGRLEGVLNLESQQPNAYSTQDRYILQIFASHAVIAIQEARLLNALQDISALILTKPLSEIHQKLTEWASNLLNIPANEIDIQNLSAIPAGSEWDKKVLSILGYYVALAAQNEQHHNDLRTAEEQHTVAEAFAAVGDIAANLLHRLNNKVGTIPVRVDGIRYKSTAALEADAYLAKNLDEIESSATQAMEIVRDNLFHLRPIELAPVSIATCIQDAIIEAALPDTVKIKIENVDALPLVQAGPKRLSLVFLNLLDNAADAMNGAGEIRIVGKEENERVIVSVSDTGPGIPPALHERIFEFNYSERAERPGKLGFGLWWVKTLMTRFGGSIRVAANAEKGATFILEF